MSRKRRPESDEDLGDCDKEGCRRSPLRVLPFLVKESRITAVYDDDDHRTVLKPNEAEGTEGVEPVAEFQPVLQLPTNVDIGKVPKVRTEDCHNCFHQGVCLAPSYSIIYLYAMLPSFQTTQVFTSNAMLSGILHLHELFQRIGRYGSDGDCLCFLSIAF